MTRYFCHHHPAQLSGGEQQRQDYPLTTNLDVKVLADEPDRIFVDQSPFIPGGGGQLADWGVIISDDVSANVVAIEVAQDGVWHSIDVATGEPDSVTLRIDEYHRRLQSELHTLAHVVNAVVFQAFDGALLTGAQLNDNGALRIDFDLPGVDNDRLRSLEKSINEAASADHEVSTFSMNWGDAEAEAGLFRAKSAAPPKSEDDTVRIVPIDDLDRQACGGTHVISTGHCRPIRIMKIENKGRQNRRVRVGIADLI